MPDLSGACVRNCQSVRLNQIAAARQYSAHRQLADLEDAARAAAGGRRSTA